MAGGNGRAGTLDAGEKEKLWNESRVTLGKLLEIDTESRAKMKEIVDKEAKMKLHEDAGTSEASYTEGKFLTNAWQSHPLKN